MTAEHRPAQPRTVYLIRRLERLVRAELDVVTRRHGLTTPGYSALSVLAVHPGLSSAQLARRAFVTAQSMNELITVMEQDKLIARRPDPAHQRILRASLTAKGRRVVARCDIDVDDIEARMLASLTPHAVAAMRASLTRSVDALDEHEPT